MLLLHCNIVGICNISIDSMSFSSFIFRSGDRATQGKSELPRRLCEGACHRFTPFTPTFNQPLHFTSIYLTIAPCLHFAHSHPPHLHLIISLHHQLTTSPHLHNQSPLFHYPLLYLMLPLPYHVTISPTLNLDATCDSCILLDHE